MEKYFHGAYYQKHCAKLIDEITAKAHMELNKVESYDRTTEYSLSYNSLWRLIKKPVKIIFRDFSNDKFQIGVFSPDPSRVFSNSGNSFKKVCKTIEKILENK